MGIVFTQTFSDNFTRANELPLNPSNWTNANIGVPGSQLGVVNNSCVADPIVGIGYELYTGTPIGPDQYVEVTISTFNANSTTSIVEPVVRGSSNNASGGYSLFLGGFGNGTGDLIVFSGDTVMFQDTITPQVGDKLKISAIGDNISAFYNEVLVFSFIDATFPTGLPGLIVGWGSSQTDTSVSFAGSGTVGVSSPQVLNLGDIRSEAQVYLMNTSADSSSFSWTVAELNSYINEGVFYTQQVTQWFEEFENIVCTASVSNYEGSTNVYQYYRVTWDRVFLPQTNEYELDRDDPSWRAAPPNNPFRFYFPQMAQTFEIVPYPTPPQNGFQYAPFSQELGVVAEFLEPDGLTADLTYQFNQELGIVIGVADTNGAIIIFRPDKVVDPFTLESAELGELQMYSTDELNIGAAMKRIPDTMTKDTDIPQLPVHCHFGLVMYAVMKAFLREGEFQDVQLAQQWFMAYGDWMESALENKARWWPTRVKSMEPFEEGSLFAKALNAIGYPLQINLKPSY